ncbi:MAG: hypothetical protein NTU73_12815 [Ignavibacteriae bacterium]|nr:hypothetical protein [Ignavibacteriota bacterium]
MITLIIFLVVILFVLFFINKQIKDNPQLFRTVNLLRVVLIIGIFIAIIFASLVQIGPGNIGVTILFGNVQDNVLKTDDLSE